MAVPCPDCKQRSARTTLARCALFSARIILSPRLRARCPALHGWSRPADNNNLCANENGWRIKKPFSYETFRLSRISTLFVSYFPAGGDSSRPRGLLCAFRLLAADTGYAARISEHQDPRREAGACKRDSRTDSRELQLVATAKKERTAPGD